jgi:hypothetical protein
LIGRKTFVNHQKNGPMDQIDMLSTERQKIQNGLRLAEYVKAYNFVHRPFEDKGTK